MVLGIELSSKRRKLWEPSILAAMEAVKGKKKNWTSTNLSNTSLSLGSHWRTEWRSELFTVLILAQHLWTLKRATALSTLANISWQAVLRPQAVSSLRYRWITWSLCRSYKGLKHRNQLMFMRFTKAELSRDEMFRYIGVYFLPSLSTTRKYQRAWNKKSSQLKFPTLILCMCNKTMTA